MTFGGASSGEKLAFFLFRILAGALFAQHGFQKVFGLFGGQRVEVASLLGVAGTIELVAGICIMIGLFTRPLAFLSAGLMLVAYGMVHAPKGLIPIENGGELALLYFIIFLVLATKKEHEFDVKRLVKLLKGR